MLKLTQAFKAPFWEDKIIILNYGVLISRVMLIAKVKNILLTTSLYSIRWKTIGNSEFFILGCVKREVRWNMWKNTEEEIPI